MFFFIIYKIDAQDIDCGNTFEPPRLGDVKPVAIREEFVATHSSLYLN